MATHDSMLSMSDMLSMPFDDLWASTQRSAQAANLREPIAALGAATNQMLQLLDFGDYGRSPRGSLDAPARRLRPLPPGTALPSNGRPHDSETFYHQFQAPPGGNGPVVMQRLTSPGYEALLRLDEENVKRGVRPEALARLKTRSAAPADGEKACTVCMQVRLRLWQQPCSGFAAAAQRYPTLSMQSRWNAQLQRRPPGYRL